MATSTWSRFHIAIVSSDGTLFPSFSSKQLSEGDADKILLADIRKHAAISKKLMFTADGKTVLDDGTALSYYIRLRGDTSDDLKNESGGTRTRAATDRKKTDGGRETRSETSNIETQQKSTIKTVQVDLILNSAGGNGGDGKGSVSSVDPAKLQEDIEKMIEKMNSDGQVKVGDLKKLSDS